MKAIALQTKGLTNHRFRKKPLFHNLPFVACSARLAFVFYVRPCEWWGKNSGFSSHVSSLGQLRIVVRGRVGEIQGDGKNTTTCSFLGVPTIPDPDATAKALRHKWEAYAIQTGSVNIPSSLEDGMLLLKYRDANGRRIAIVDKFSKASQSGDGVTLLRHVATMVKDVLSLPFHMKQLCH